MKERPRILLADLLRAIRGLEVSEPEERQEVAALLGLSLGERRQPELSEPAVESGGSADLPGDAEGDREVRGQARHLRTIPSDLRHEQEPDPVSRERRRPPIQAPPLVAPTTGPSTPPDPEPLFVPRWTPGILTASLTTRDEGPVDVPRAVELIARANPLKRVPRLLRATLRNGVQVLLDRSESMLPFNRDQQVLLRQLYDVVGAHRVEVLRFAGCPSRGAGPTLPQTWDTYEPPRPGTPVLVVSDLGAGESPLAVDTASREEWHAFVSDVLAAGCEVVAFVPYPRERLPEGLPRSLRIVQWDRSTSARDARRAARGPLGSGW